MMVWRRHLSYETHYGDPVEVRLRGNNGGTTVSLFVLWVIGGDGCRARWHSSNNVWRDKLPRLGESGALRRWQHYGNILVHIVGCVDRLSSIGPILGDDKVARRTSSIPFVRLRRNRVVFVMAAVVARGCGGGTAV